MNASVALMVLVSAAAIVPQDHLTLRSIAERCVSKGGQPDLVLPALRDGASRLLRVRPYRFTFSESIQVAQGGRDARDRDDGATARSNALLGTPNKKTPVPQDNLFSTSPRLEQQVPKPEDAASAKDARDATPTPLATPR